MLTRSAFRHSLLAFSLILVPLLSSAPPESNAKVYLLRMKDGFDLHLANRLTEAGLMTVVTDPREADYVLTEGVGPRFEAYMEQLFRAPEDEEAKSEEDKDSGGSGDKKSGAMVAMSAKAPVRASSFGRSSGTVFLVRRADSSVVWSTFLRRQDSREEMLHKNAGEVVKRLKKQMTEDERAAMGPNP